MSLPDFDTLLASYERYRIGYSRDLIDLVLSQARPGARILDLAAGTGLATRDLPTQVVASDVAPAMLARNPTPRKALARAEALPFRDASFGLVTVAQAFHWFDPARSLAEMARVLSPGGVAALWWKYEAPRDETEAAANAAFERVVGKPAPQTAFETDPLPDVTPLGFEKEDRRVVPWAVATTVESYVGYHASRENLRRGAGPKRDAVLAEMTRVLREMHPSGRFVIPYEQRVSFLRRS